MFGKVMTRAIWSVFVGAVFVGYTTVVLTTDASFDDGRTEAYPVLTWVNYPKNDSSAASNHPYALTRKGQWVNSRSPEQRRLSL